MNTCSLLHAAHLFLEIFTIYLVILANLQLITFWNGLTSNFINWDPTDNPLISRLDTNKSRLPPIRNNAVPNKSALQTSLSINFPLICVWMISLSLSIPELYFFLSFASKSRKCLVRTDNDFEIILITFRLIIPFILIAICCILLFCFCTCKSNSKSKSKSNAIQNHFQIIQKFAIYCLFLDLYNLSVIAIKIYFYYFQNVYEIILISYQENLQIDDLLLYFHYSYYFCILPKILAYFLCVSRQLKFNVRK